MTDPLDNPLSPSQGMRVDGSLDPRHEANRSLAMELIKVPEPVMAQFDRLPLAMRMRVAARVMDEVNTRFRAENPRMGFSQNEPISPSSMRWLADQWEREGYYATVSPACQDCGATNRSECCVEQLPFNREDHPQ